MKPETDGQGVKVTFSGMSFKALTFRDAIEAMSILFYLTGKFDEEFGLYINVDASRGGPTGTSWAIYRGELGYLFELAVDEPVGGFGGHLVGNAYAYKIGDDPELVDHPSNENFEVPRHCFIDRETVRGLINELRESDDPDLTGGFVFDPAHWQPVW